MMDNLTERDEATLDSDEHLGGLRLDTITPNDYGTEITSTEDDHRGFSEVVGLQTKDTDLKINQSRTVHRETVGLLTERDSLINTNRFY
jgi:hypothetical protein